MTRAGALALRAHAKINLGLAVLALRGDGLHEIDTLFARLALHDRLVLRPTPAGVSGRCTAGDPRLDLAGLAMDEGNLAHRAAARYLDLAGRPGGVDLALEKRIPLAAGLGGGSSDAAATLRGLARLYPADVDLEAIARALGSDVPFFLADVAGARGRGRGERLDPLALPARRLVLVNPGVPVSAGSAYAALQAFAPRLDVDALLAALAAPGGEVRIPNALQAGVTLEQPAVREALDALRSAGLTGVAMSGSGATCFGLAADRGDAARAARRLRGARPDWWVAVTRLA